MKRSSFFILLFILVSALNILCLYQDQQWSFLIMFSQTKKLVAACSLVVIGISYSAVLDWKERKGRQNGGSEAT